MATRVRCLACGTKADLVEESEQRQDRIVSCSVCGLYRATGRLLASPKGTLDDQLRGMLAGVLYRFWVAHMHTVFPQVLDTDTVAGIVAAHGAPSNHAERADEIVRAVAVAAPKYGEWTLPDWSLRWAIRAYSIDTAELDAMLRDYRDWIESRADSPANRQLSLRLTRAGWDRLRMLAETRAESRTISLASWALPAVRQPFERAAAEAADDLGLRVESGNALAEPTRIDDSIIAALRRARVVVADFTGLRGGVYYEAGFAAGLGTPVMFTCHSQWTRFLWLEEVHDASTSEAPTPTMEAWRKGMHFDVAHFPIFEWASQEELRKLVVDHVRAWGLAAPGHAG